MHEPGTMGGAVFYSFSLFLMFDPMSDLEDGSAQGGDPLSGGSMSGGAPQSDRPPRRSGGGGGFSDNVHSISIRTRQRTFYIDLKESSNGKFFKVSEKSRGGQKSTIMFDAEDLDEMIAALTEMKGHL